MSTPLMIIGYLISAAVLVFFSVKLANYVDLLDKKTNISGAFIGGVVLAAVTSLPELVTSLSAVFVVDNPELIIGNVLGSNIFNLCIFGGGVMLAAKAFSKAKIGKSHVITILCTLAVSALLAITFWVRTKTGVTFGQIPVININVMSLLVLVVYIVSFRFLSNDDSDNDEEDTSPLTVKQIIIRFVFMAVGLVGMSVVVTWFTNQLQERFQLDASLAGAIFLGVATSLPELTSSITLIRHKNFNATVGNVVGSNMFNFTIFSIADIFAGTQIYPSSMAVSYETKNMLIFGVISSLLTMGALLMQSRLRDKPTKGGILVLYASIGVLIIASYVVSLILPFSLIG